jgi:type IV pilus assembly protein PilA
MIVVAIIGILAAIAIPAYNGYIKTSKINSAHDNADGAYRFLKNEAAKFAAGAPGAALMTQTAAVDALNEGGKRNPFLGTETAFTGGGGPNEGQVDITVSGTGTSMATSGTIFTVTIGTGTTLDASLGGNLEWVADYASGVSVVIE